MRAYSAEDEESFRARKLLKEWRDEGLLSSEQFERLLAETPCELRTTNVFLRAVLLLFTLLAVVTAVGLCLVLMGGRSNGSTAGVIWLVFAGLSYFAAEMVVSQAGHYRHGVEEAFAVAAVGLLCIGAGQFFFSGYGVQVEHHMLELISLTGTLSSLWVWYRFGLPYAFPAAMIFAAIGPVEWLSSHVAQRCVICVLYACGLASVAAVGARHRYEYLRARYSLAEASLWFGIYLTLNLKLSALGSPAELWSAAAHTTGFPAAFYWVTWVLLWLLPPVILVRAVRQKDRFILAAGMLTAFLTLVTNKPYLGWQRHTWDPMLLGVALVDVAVFLLRRLARGPDGVRYGCTAGSLSGKQKQGFGVASSMMGFVSPHALTPAAQPQARDAGFDSGFGGSSGGGGASGEF